jgi:hypothetical protein
VQAKRKRFKGWNVKQEKAIKALEKAGYKKSDRDGSFGDVVLHKRSVGSECQTNHRPPLFTISIYENTDFNPMSIRIRGKTASNRWIDTGYYSLPLEEVDNIKELEYTIEKSWEAFN